MKKSFLIIALTFLAPTLALAQSACVINNVDYPKSTYDSTTRKLFFVRANTLFMKPLETGEETEVYFTSSNSTVLDVAISQKGLIILAQDSENQGSLTARWLYLLDPESLKVSEKILVQNVPANGSQLADLFVGDSSRLAYILNLEPTGTSQRKVSSILEVNLRDKSIQFKNDSPILLDVEIYQTMYTYSPSKEAVYSIRQGSLYAYRLEDSEIKAKTLGSDQIRSLSFDAASGDLLATGYRNRPEAQEKDLKVYKIGTSGLEIEAVVTLQTVPQQAGAAVEQIFPTGTPDTYLILTADGGGESSLFTANFVTGVVSPISCP
jgi:hypothetical protein